MLPRGSKADLDEQLAATSVTQRSPSPAGGYVRVCARGVTQVEEQSRRRAPFLDEGLVCA